MTAEIFIRTVILPAYEILRSLLLSRGGAQEDHMACMAGNVTPWGGKKYISDEI